MTWTDKLARLYLLRGYVYGKMGEYDKAAGDFSRSKKLAEEEEIFSKARDNLNALRVLQPDRVMKRGGIALSSLAGVVLVALTVFYYLDFPFKKPTQQDTPSAERTSEKSGRTEEAATVTESTYKKEESKKIIKGKPRQESSDSKEEPKEELSVTEITEKKEETKKIAKEAPEKTTKGKQARTPEGEGEPEEGASKFITHPTYIAIVPICLFFMAMGFSLPFITKIKFKDAEIDKATIAGASSGPELKR